ncbi:MAG TPA: YbjN domain-containing protein [Candidatus Limnocylindrales bacterium]|nr:YbjN domain-containing protein [Candidatus Limnocylindrales bacterium]
MSDRSARGGAHAEPAARATTADAIEGWLRDLHELGLEAGERVERDGIAAWDVTIDGRRRRDLRTTVIFDPNLGLICWAHLAPPLGDGLRKAYRTLLRWNDEFPLAKLSVADDGRPILSVEVPIRWLDADELGLALARIAGIADRVFEDTRGWLWIGGRVPDGYAERPVRTRALLDRYAARLGELVTPDDVQAPEPISA